MTKLREFESNSRARAVKKCCDVNPVKCDQCALTLPLRSLFHSCRLYRFICIHTEFSPSIQNTDSVSPKASNGLWCIFLVPGTYLVTTLRYSTPLCFKFATCQSVGILLQSILFIIFGSISPGYLDKGSSLLPGLISSALCYAALQQDLIFSLAISFSAPYLFNIAYRQLNKRMPKTFTVGEAFILVQQLTIFMTTVGFLVYDAKRIEQWDDVLIIRHISYVGIATIIGFILFLSYNLVQWKTSIFFYLLAGVLIIMIMFLERQMGVNPVLWMVEYLFFNKFNLALLGLWACAVLAAVFITIYQTISGKASTSSRKTYHFLAAFVYTSGVFYQIDLLRLASAVTFAGVLLLEDVSGGFALTPIGLFIGLCCPLILPIHTHDLIFLSGVLSVGIGDAVASWYGSKYGLYKLQGSDKTVDGTVANAISQAGFVLVLCLFDYVDWSANILIQSLLSAICSACVEAFTDQVDNLIVPYVSTIIMLLT